MDQRTIDSIVNAQVVGTQIMDALKEKSPSTRFEFSTDKREIAAWDEGKGKWMAICGISNLGQWTPAKHLFQYVDGDHTAYRQVDYPKAA